MKEKKLCSCAEGRISRDRVEIRGAPTNVGPDKDRPMPGVHDCGYVAARNALIPLAEAEADRAPKSESWSIAFHRAMNRLWSSEAALRSRLVRQNLMLEIENEATKTA